MVFRLATWTHWSAQEIGAMPFSRMIRYQANIPKQD
jgi:hypothetical protein